MDILRMLNKICTPAQVYLAISLASVIAMLLQNCQDNSVYRIGNMVVKSPCHNLAFFAVKILYIMLWTWLLNLLCKKGFTSVSWLLVLLPIVGMFVLIGMVFLMLK
tara:strand:+ start:32018 stop:32335 length:318 start_codon:yes stop_codon:yes gene_type:complete